MRLIKAKQNSRIRSERMAESRKKGAHTKKEWDALKISCGNICVFCHGASGLINLEKDHIVPIYLGGSDSIDNIQPACARCNASKGCNIDDNRPYGWKILFDFFICKDESSCGDRYGR